MPEVPFSSLSAVAAKSIGSLFDQPLIVSAGSSGEPKTTASKTVKSATTTERDDALLDDVVRAVTALPLGCVHVGTKAFRRHGMTFVFSSKGGTTPLTRTRRTCNTVRTTAAIGSRTMCHISIWPMFKTFQNAPAPVALMPSLA